jgi:hypothetical protein
LVNFDTPYIANINYGGQTSGGFFLTDKIDEFKIEIDSDNDNNCEIDYKKYILYEEE